jgi:hypothetical protein
VMPYMAITPMISVFINVVYNLGLEFFRFYQYIT